MNAYASDPVLPTYTTVRTVTNLAFQCHCQPYALTQGALTHLSSGHHACFGLPGLAGGLLLARQLSLQLSHCGRQLGALRARHALLQQRQRMLLQIQLLRQPAWIVLIRIKTLAKGFCKRS